MAKADDFFQEKKAKKTEKTYGPWQEGYDDWRARFVKSLNYEEAMRLLRRMWDADDNNRPMTWQDREEGMIAYHWIQKNTIGNMSKERLNEVKSKIYKTTALISK